MQRGFPYVTVTAKAEKAAAAGHPWVYGAEITAAGGKPLADGGLTDVYSPKGRWLGCGFYNSHSKIAVRLVSHNANDTFDAAFWRRRVQYAWRYRQSAMMPDELGCCRLVHGEADQLPGLTVDRYGDILVAQILCLGMDMIKDVVLPALVDVLRQDGVAIRGVYLRNDVAIRELEGLPQGQGWYALDVMAQPDTTRIRIRENGLDYDIDVAAGQKTGYFLDQKRNRAAAGRLSRGHRVLDCFCNVGGFALNCAASGAEAVTGVDVSQAALDQAAANARLNGLSAVRWQKADVFDLLRQMVKDHDQGYDFIILDPPAFTKARSSIDSAEYGYLQINQLAMRILPRGGWLVTCSCSHFMTPPRFKAMLAQAAAGAGVELKQVAAFQQCADHPILWNVPETEYLQLYMFQVI